MPTIQASSNFELAKLHLDRFWHEIFWRRDNEQKITVWTVGLYGALLALVYGQNTSLDILQKVILSCFPVMLGTIAAWYLYKNWKKGKEIAQIIVRLNEALGAWDVGVLTQGEKPLYPSAWRTWGQAKFKQDKVSLYYFRFILFATALTVIGIFVK
jgi:hypothetical protein